MNITPIRPKLNNFYINTAFKSSKISTAAPKDTFVKSKSESQIKISDEYKALYDSVYESAMKLNYFINPFLKEIKINKPELIIGDNLEENFFYKQSENSINISSKFLTCNHYLLVQYDENNKISGSASIVPEYNLEKSLKKLPNVHAIMLNEEEKKLYFEALIAHEIRHCIQVHFLLSCKSTNEEMKKTVKKSISKIQEMSEALSSLTGCKYDKSDTEHYFLKYKPKKLLDDSVLFKESMRSDNTEYWSADEFLRGNICYPENEQDEDYYKQYYNNPMEIDAFTFENEYFLYQIMTKKNPAIRENIIYCIWGDMYYLANRYKEYENQPIWHGKNAD